MEPSEMNSVLDELINMYGGTKAAICDRVVHYCRLLEPQTNKYRKNMHFYLLQNFSSS